MEYISVITNKYKKENNKQYKYIGDGRAWYNKKILKNDLFFNDRKILNIVNNSSNGTRLLKISDSKKITSNEYKLISLDDYKNITEYNEIIQLENGDYLIQKITKNGEKRSLFMGYHEKEKLILPYFYALNLLSKLDFKKIASNNINKNSNIFSIFEIIGNSNTASIKNKLFLKKTIIKIDKYDLSIADKKELIRKYNSKFEDKIIMFNNGNYFILDVHDPNNKFA